MLLFSRIMFTGIFVVALGVAGVGQRPAEAEDWSQFRGPNSSGVASESTNPPVTFSFEDNVRWSMDLGPGVACPVIAQGRTFITGMSEEGTFSIYCLDATTGEQIWQTDFEDG